MKILHVCYTDGRGGAGIGAKRLHDVMRSYGLNSSLLVANKFSEDKTVFKLRPDRFRRIKHKINRKMLALHGTQNPVLRSTNIFGRGAVKFINNYDADIVQFHWICADMIAIREFKKINKPIVWKLPDMWAFSGAEHYLLPGDPARYKDGYNKANRPQHESGIDLNRYIWRYKQFAWRNAPFSIVCPSKWLAECARESILFKDREVFNIANPINLDLYRPLPKLECREMLGLPKNKKLILFGALASSGDSRKGFHFLDDALKKLSYEAAGLEFDLVILGKEGEISEELHGVKIHNLGRTNSQEKIVKVYSACDFHVFPTQSDNLPNVVKEASACGLPCVGFRVGGMSDMIAHKKTGYLASPYKTESLADGIRWLLSQDLKNIAKRVRQDAEALHDPEKCVEKYLHVYKKQIKNINC